MATLTRALSTGDDLLDEDGTTAQLSLDAPEARLAHDEGPAADVKLQGAHLFGSLAHDAGAARTDAQFLASHLFAALTTDNPAPTAADLLGRTDFASVLTGREAVRYVMDAATPAGDVRIPIKSWQATQQVERSNYVQCVIPNAGAWLDEINAMTAFTIYRVVDVEGLTIEYEMVTSAAEEKQSTRGPNSYSAVISGYSDGFATDSNPATEFDRTLSNIRLTQNTATSTRVRCDIDWFLRPAQRAYIDENTSFVVSYINYYVTTAGTSLDEYMDVGERS